MDLSTTEGSASNMVSTLLIVLGVERKAERKRNPAQKNDKMICEIIGKISILHYGHDCCSFGGRAGSKKFSKLKEKGGR